MQARLSILMKYPLGSAAVLAFLVVLLLMGWRRVTEPRVMGQGVREWVRELPYDDAENSPAREAIDSMGIEAVPYLLEVMDGPSRIEMWLASKAARLLNEPDLLEQKMYVSGAARSKLTVMTRAERLGNAMRSDAAYPVREAIWPKMLDMLEDRPQHISRVLPLLDEIGPLKPAAKEAARAWWARYKLRQFDYSVREAAMLLAAQGDPAFLPDFLDAVGVTNLLDVRVTALDAIGELGYRNGVVEKTVLAAVRDPLPEIKFAGLRACALLGMSPPEAAKMFYGGVPEKVSAKPFTRLDAPWAMLLWLNDTNNETEAARVEMDLRPTTHLRLMTVKLLGRAGPKAKRFVPEVVGLLNDPVLLVRSEAIEALRRIDPEMAEREIQHRMVAADDAKRP